MSKIILLIILVCIFLFIFGCIKPFAEAREPAFRGANIIDENKMLQLTEQGYFCRYHKEMDFNEQYERCFERYNKIYPNESNLCGGSPINNCRNYYENCAENGIVPAGWFCRIKKQGLTEDEKNNFEQNQLARCWYYSEPVPSPPHPETGEISYIPKGWVCDIPYRE